jgi:hypothetical protein
MLFQKTPMTYLDIKFSQIIAQNYRIGEISCPTKYFKEASSINFIRSLKYGLGCVYWSIIYFLGRIKIYHHPLIFKKK